MAKIASNYWENNPGSEERLPWVSRLIPTLSVDQAAAIVTRAVERECRKATGPLMYSLFTRSGARSRVCPLVCRLQRRQTTQSAVAEGTQDTGQGRPRLPGEPRPASRSAYEAARLGCDRDSDWHVNSWAGGPPGLAGRQPPDGGR